MGLSWLMIGLASVGYGFIDGSTARIVLQ